MISLVPVMVTERLELVELKSFQKQPLSDDVKLGTVKALNPVLVSLQIPAEFVEVKVKEVADTSVVMERYSVGRTKRRLFVAESW